MLSESNEFLAFSVRYLSSRKLFRSFFFLQPRFISEYRGNSYKFPKADDKLVDFTQFIAAFQNNNILLQLPRLGVKHDDVEIRQGALDQGNPLIIYKKNLSEK